ncbi:MAG: hypothetical protein WCF30_06670 [Terracidiphilus sp.]
MITDKGRQIILNSSRSFAFFANPITRDLEVVRLDDGFPASEDFLRAIAQRGLRYAATLGIVDGEPCVALQTAFDEHTTFALARAVAVFVLVLMGDEPEQRPDDFESFITGLVRLEDPRV